jgi:hypothetical protein
MPGIIDRRFATHTDALQHHATNASAHHQNGYEHNRIWRN